MFRNHGKKDLDISLDVAEFYSRQSFREQKNGFAARIVIYLDDAFDRQLTLFFLSSRHIT
jgi:hypothetical protein